MLESSLSTLYLSPFHIMSFITEDADICNHGDRDDESCYQDEETRDVGHPYSQHQDLHPTDIKWASSHHPELGADPQSDALTSLPSKSKLEDVEGPIIEEKSDKQGKQAKANLSPQQHKELDKLRADYDLFIAPIEEYLPKSEGNQSDEVPRIAIIPQG